MNISWFLLFVTLGFIEVNSWKFFHHGRMVGGNLGAPVTTRINAEDVEEKWFTQSVDHFNPNNEDTWQQVSRNKKK